MMKVGVDSGASYVRNVSGAVQTPDSDVRVRRALESAMETAPFELKLRIWGLLETPQTVETICRTLEDEFKLVRASCAQGVGDVFSRLYEEDLIQLSPDT